MLNYMKKLALRDPDLRRESLKDILTQENLPFTIQTPFEQGKRLRPVENYLLKFGDEDKPCLLLCAHYDSHPGSFGANDNAAAVSILIHLAKTVQNSNLTVEFAFFDGEEENFEGSKLYVKQMVKNSVTGVINLDVCGYGDNIVIHDKGTGSKPSLHKFCNKEFLTKHNAQLVKFLPPSDNRSFRGRGIPNMSVAVVPKWDIGFLNTLGNYNDGFGLRTPEFEMILGQLEVMTTMHGGYRDVPEAIDENAMQMVYDYVWQGLNAPESKKKLFGFL